MRAPSPFHAVEELRLQLLAHGYAELKEKEKWQISPAGKYFFTRNKSSIVAFAVGGKWSADRAGFSIVGAHTDSPCLKLKPVSKKEKLGWLQLGVQTYGGGLFHTWFDRDLSVAGRAVVEANDKLENRLVRISGPILRIPNLAIHLDRTVSEAFKFNAELQLTPVLGLARKEPATNGVKESDDTGKSFADHHHLVLLQALAKEMGCEVSQIRDLELCLYDTQPPTLGGIGNEFIFSARLDNLMMSWCSMQALLASNSDPQSLANDTQCRMVALFDNEEVGSTSAYGADSHYMEATLRRIVAASGLVHPTAFEESIHRSFMISADMAHAVHPNYADKHEENHRPVMGGGLVIKTNANQRYASTAVTSTVIRELAKKRKLPIQEFVVRNDSPCGSTIGPLLSAKLGLRTVDVGAPQLSMHSIREQAGAEDVPYSVDLFTEFFEGFADLDSRISVD
ncbi:peptidase M18 [Hyaloraphidium curvatum]|nr:peptidase M18 [Hyaloraphidium curvatum]